MHDHFTEYASADAIVWLGERWTVVEAGRDVSDVDGRHLLLARDGREYPIHERLVQRWAEQHPDRFKPADAATVEG